MVGPWQQQHPHLVVRVWVAGLVGLVGGLGGLPAGRADQPAERPVGPRPADQAVIHTVRGDKVDNLEVIISSDG